MSSSSGYEVCTPIIDQNERKKMHDCRNNTLLCKESLHKRIRCIIIIYVMVYTWLTYGSHLEAIRLNSVLQFTIKYNKSSVYFLHHRFKYKLKDLITTRIRNTLGHIDTL